MAANVVVTGTLELKKGWFDGTQWVTDEDTYDLPLNEDLSMSNLVIEVRQDGPEDAPAPLIKEEIVSGPSFPYNYTVNFPRPTGILGTILLSATLNMNWKANQTAWIREGDWHTDTTYSLDVRTVESAVQDMYLVHYPLRKSDAGAFEKPTVTAAAEPEVEPVQTDTY